MKAKKTEISGSLHLEKARALFDEMRVNSAIARLRDSRNHLKFVKLRNFRDVDTTSVNHWIKKSFSPIFAEYELQNVFNFDEAELVYCAILDGNFVCTEEDHDWRKKSKERKITIELTMSRAGEKLRLWVIDQSLKL